MTHCYLISYDLSGEEEYDSLYEAIRAYGTWAHIHESLWAVVTQSSARQVYEDLVQHVGPTGRLLVVRSGVESAWSNPICRNAWLKKNL